MDNVTYPETDTFDEVNRILNRLIDNQNSLGKNLDLIEAKILALDSKKKKDKKEKGGKNV